MNNISINYIIIGLIISLVIFIYAIISREGIKKDIILILSHFIVSVIIGIFFPIFVLGLVSLLIFSSVIIVFDYIPNVAGEIRLHEDAD